MYFFLQSLGAILYIYENKVEFYILAVKAGKRVADDASNLQANSPKKIKLDQHNTKAKSPEKKAKSVGKLETKEEKIELELEDDSQSPVKTSKSNKNRIISDSEDESPVKKSPQKVEKESKPTFSIFQKKSPKKFEATPDKNEDKTPKSSSKSTLHF